MKKQNEKTIQCTGVSSLPITQWHELAQASLEIPITTTLVGNSMRPLIRRGIDRVTIIPLRRKLCKGDVVLFSRGDGVYVVHRVWKLKDNKVQTLGDNCYFPDSWIPKEDVWGLVVRFERNGHSLPLDCRLSRSFGYIWMALLPARVCCHRAHGLIARGMKKIFREGKRR